MVVVLIFAINMVRTFRGFHVSTSLLKIPVVLFASLIWAGCAHKLMMRGSDGERIEGRWRHAREDTGLMQVMSSEGELLAGVLAPTGRRAFFESYQSVFGAGAIAAENPDLSAHGQGFWMSPGTTNVLRDAVFGESFDPVKPPAIAGPLTYWTAYLQGDRRSSMRCFLIRSNHSGRGLGRCKAAGGKEYTVQF